MPFIILDWSFTGRLLLQPIKACDAVSLCLLGPNNEKSDKALPLEAEDLTERGLEYPKKAPGWDQGHLSELHESCRIDEWHTTATTSSNSYCRLTKNVMSQKNARKAYFPINLMQVTMVLENWHHAFFIIHQFSERNKLCYFTTISANIWNLGMRYRGERSFFNWAVVQSL